MLAKPCSVIMLLYTKKYLPSHCSRTLEEERKAEAEREKQEEQRHIKSEIDELEIRRQMTTKALGNIILQYAAYATLCCRYYRNKMGGRI